MDLPAPAKKAANVYGVLSIVRVIKYLHAATSFPTQDTWLQAMVNGHYILWPGITIKNVWKHFPESIKTQKGHKKQWQNTQFTENHGTCGYGRWHWANENTQKHNIMIKVINAHNTMYTDCRQGGSLCNPAKDTDYLWSSKKSMETTSTSSQCKTTKAACSSVHIKCCGCMSPKRGTVKPKVHILDTKHWFYSNQKSGKNCDLQLVPPDTHQRKEAGQTLQMFKAHFIAFLPA